MKRNQALLLLAAFCSSLTTSAVAISSSAFSVNAWKQNSDEEMAIRLRVRGGSSESPKKKSKKRSKKSGKAKKAISDAMKEKDAAKALGDAIRYVIFSIVTFNHACIAFLLTKTKQIPKQ
jgi:hypothetical protein